MRISFLEFNTNRFNRLNKIYYLIIIYIIIYIITYIIIYIITYIITYIIIYHIIIIYKFYKIK
jgi:hypothetical protein